MTPQSVLEILRKPAKRAGVKHFSPYDLRRTFISALLDAGPDIATVQRLAGTAGVTPRKDLHAHPWTAPGGTLLLTGDRPTHRVQRAGRSTRDSLVLIA